MRASGIIVAMVAALAGTIAASPAPRLAFQVYAVRDLCEKDFAGTLKAAKALGYEGVETGRFYGLDAKGLKAACDDAGLELVALQLYPHNLTEPQLGETIRFCKECGCRRINVAWYKGSEENPNDWQLLVNVLNHAAEVCAKEGIAVAYHNHDHEFSMKLGGRSVWEWLYAEDGGDAMRQVTATPRFSRRILQELDCGNCVLGGGDPLACLAAHPHRNPTVHVMPAIEDAKGLRPGECGVGSAADRADWRRILPALAADGVEWLVVKPTAHPDSLADLKSSIEYIKHECREWSCRGGQKANADDMVLFDAASADASRLSAQNGATFSLTDGLLTVNTSPSDLYPGVCISGEWDLSRHGRIEVEFVNGGINGQYTLRLLNPGGNPGKQKGSKVFKLAAGRESHAVIGVDMVSRHPQLDAISKRLKPLRVWALPYAAGVPYEAYRSRKSAPMLGIGELDPKDVVQVAVYINQPKLPHTWSVKRIVAKKDAAPSSPAAAQPWTRLSEKEFFPYIDQYGQFRHKDWPDKVHSDADFARQREKEEKDLAAHPGPKGWDKWGGWADGPQLPKTGGFSTTKWNGKWWIVDPDGHLWWSHGPVRVLPSSAMTPLATPNGDRAGWFENLPKRDDPVFGAFYETRDDLLWPYYTKRGIASVYDFSAANIRRKYGEKWFETWADLAHRRLRSWSCNTIANSSDKRICLMDRTPYTERFEIHARPIAGHKGGWWEFCDPFDTSFRAEARRMTEVYRAEIEDPWCMGFFVDNEHHWGSAHSFGLSTLKSPADQPCKAVFRDRMKAKYGTVAKLNAAWGMAYRDWDDFLRVTKEPKSFNGAKADLEAFSSEIAETYFRIIREELKRANPGKLYLGCRWAGGAPAFTVKAAAKYCDVISYNVYRKEMSQFKLPEGIDAPVMIGEFHFGALDRGPFCPGLILLRDQKHRAETYKEYVRTSLEHPQIVGVHWHQFSDQATSGRFDGENMQVGWTDVCDTPYWETVEAVREIGSKMYEIRAAGQGSVGGRTPSHKVCGR